MYEADGVLSSGLDVEPTSWPAGVRQNNATNIAVATARMASGTQSRRTGPSLSGFVLHQRKPLTHVGQDIRVEGLRHQIARLARVVEFVEKLLPSLPIIPGNVSIEFGSDRVAGVGPRGGGRLIGRSTVCVRSRQRGCCRTATGASPGLRLVGCWIARSGTTRGS